MSLQQDGESTTSTQHSRREKAYPNAISCQLELPPPFHGSSSQNFHTWIRRFEICVQAAYDSSEETLAKLLPARLDGAALKIWDSLSSSEQNDYTVTKKKLESVFSRKQDILSFQSSVKARPRQPEEPLEVYAAEITRMVLLAFPDYGRNAIEGETFRRFIAGLDTDLQSKCFEFGVKTMSEALQIASQCERAKNALKVIATPNLQSLPEATGTVSTASVQLKSTPSNFDIFLLDSMKELTTKLDNLQTTVTRLQVTVSSLQTEGGQSSFHRGRDVYRDDRFGRAYPHSPEHRYNRSPSPYTSRPRHGNTYQQDDRNKYHQRSECDAQRHSYHHSPSRQRSTSPHSSLRSQRGRYSPPYRSSSPVRDRHVRIQSPERESREYSHQGNEY